MRFFLSLVFYGYATFLFGQKTIPVLQAAPFLSITAQAGDDIPSIIQRYGLSEEDCDIEQFFKLNKLREGNYRLKAGKSYKLPIQVLRYNGKSIRSTLDIEDWKTAKNISDFNTTASKNGVRADDFVKSKVLWVPWHSFNCELEKIASIPIAEGKIDNKKPGSKAPVVFKIIGGEPHSLNAPRNFPIFGKEHANTPLLSTKLRGKVFFLVSGHGGPDPGAQGKRAGHTLCEDEYAYDVTLRLLRFLISHNATAYMIVRDPGDGIRDQQYLDCDKDEVVWGDKVIPLNQKERLGQRTALINKLSDYHKENGQTDQTIIEIHVDSRSKATETDVFFYYRPNSEPSMDLALHIHQTFIQKYQQKRGPARRYEGSVSSRDLFTLRETTAPKAVYIEMANIKNDWDQQRIVLNNNRQAIANWIGEALLK
jgi:N-acetylmuramoyl-L-alanine amidase